MVFQHSAQRHTQAGFPQIPESIVRQQLFLLFDFLYQSKRPEEREFYLRLAIREQWSSRELERQFKSALFERTVLSPAKVSPLVRQIHPDALNIFKDSYMVEFLDLPQGHAEADLHLGLLQRLKDFLIELGISFRMFQASACSAGTNGRFRSSASGR